MRKTLCEEILDQLENQRYENMLEVLKGIQTLLMKQVTQKSRMTHLQK